MALIRLPGGTFRMGTPATAIEQLRQQDEINFRGRFTPETSQHPVELAPFFIDPCPVTNRQCKAFVDAHPQWQRDQIPALI